MRVGVLTGGGDCPGLNAAIRAIVRKGIATYGHEIVGLRDGWRGPLESLSEELTIESTGGILPRGGTILGTSRTNPFKRDDGVDRVRETFEGLRLDGLIAIGGEDTLGAAAKLHDDHGLPVLGVPKTIDNDIGATDQTFGFDTALQVATDAIDRLHTTAESHHRVMVVEVMGRHAGWIALHSGLRWRRRRDPDPRAAVRHRGGLWADPPPPWPRPLLLDRRRRARGPCRRRRTMATTDGELDEFGPVRLGGIGQRLETEIEERTGFETRAMVLGHIQRGGTPTAFDRVLATRLGVAAIDAAHEGRWGTMPALHGPRIELVPLRDAVAELRTVQPEDFTVAEPFLG